MFITEKVWWEQPVALVVEGFGLLAQTFAIDQEAGYG